MTCSIELNTAAHEETIEEMPPMALSTHANAADHHTWDQAMNRPNSQGYWEACKKELHTLMTKMKSWEVTRRES